MRNLHIIRSSVSEDRIRTSHEMQRLLVAILGRTLTSPTTTGSESHPLRTRPISLKSLQLDHVTERDIAYLPQLLPDHPSLTDFGFNLWPYNQRRMPSTMLHALEGMPKLRHLKVSVMHGRVLANGKGSSWNRGIAGKPTTPFAKLRILEVTLPQAKQVLFLMAQLATPENSLALQELHLTTDAPVKDTVQSIASLIENTTTLEELQLCFRTSRLDDYGCTVLAQALAINDSLTYMGLGPWLSIARTRKYPKAFPDGIEGISRHGGCAALVKALEQNMNLLSLTFQGGTWPGQTNDLEDDEESNGIHDVSDTENLSETDDSESANEARLPVLADGNLDESSSAITFSVSSSASSVSTLSSNIFVVPKLGDEIPPFPMVASFYLGLNRCGRRDLLREGTMSTKEDWINMLAAENCHTGRLFYFLSNNPTLFLDKSKTK